MYVDIYKDVHLYMYRGGMHAMYMSLMPYGLLIEADNLKYYKLT